MNRPVDIPAAAAAAGAPVAPPPDRPARLSDVAGLGRRVAALGEALKPIAAAARQAAEDRAAAEARLASVERALNALEGEVCIRLEPSLRAALAAPPQPARSRRPLLALVLFAAGLGLGIVHGETLRAQAGAAVALGLELAAR
jgi:hypothetical protein